MLCNLAVVSLADTALSVAAIAAVKDDYLDPGRAVDQR